MSAEPTSAEILIVGAGIAGLRAARTLHDAGKTVALLEKSRGLGGRAATKRLHGTHADHGAQYFTARDPRFQKQIDEWVQTGVLEVWTRGFHKLTPGGLEAPDEGYPRYAFPDGMNTFGKLLGDGLDVRREALVTELAKTTSGWNVTLSDGTVYTAETLILNAPAPQALILGQDVFSGDTRDALSRVEFAPCLALMAGFAQAAPEWSGIEAKDGPVSWVANDSSKHSGTDTEETRETTLVLHGSPAFSERHLETPETALPEMLAVAASLGFTEPLWTRIQRWRYSKVTQPYDGSYLKGDDNLYLCGDWCGGAKVEAAYLSGLEVAGAVLES